MLPFRPIHDWDNEYRTATPVQHLLERKRETRCSGEAGASPHPLEVARVADGNDLPIARLHCQPAHQPGSHSTARERFPSRSISAEHEHSHLVPTTANQSRQSRPTRPSQRATPGRKKRDHSGRYITPSTFPLLSEQGAPLFASASLEQTWFRTAQLTGFERFNSRDEKWLEWLETQAGVLTPFRTEVRSAQ